MGVVALIGLSQLFAIREASDVSMCCGVMRGSRKFSRRESGFDDVFSFSSFY